MFLMTLRFQYELGTQWIQKSVVLTLVLCDERCYNPRKLTWNPQNMEVWFGRRFFLLQCLCFFRWTSRYFFPGCTRSHRTANLRITIYSPPTFLVLHLPGPLEWWKTNKGCWSKNMVKLPKSSMINRVSNINHPFWGEATLFFGSTPTKGRSEHRRFDTRRILREDAA